MTYNQNSLYKSGYNSYIVENKKKGTALCEQMLCEQMLCEQMLCEQMLCEQMLVDSVQLVGWPIVRSSFII